MVTFYFEATGPLIFNNFLCRILQDHHIKRLDRLKYAIHPFVSKSMEWALKDNNDWLFLAHMYIISGDPTHVHPIIWGG